MASPKRPRDVDACTLCISISMNNKSNICSNKLYEYTYDYTWQDIFSDVVDSLDDDDFQPHKTDEVSVSVTDKLSGTVVFHPDMLEEIRVVRNFDKHLKYCTFKIRRSETTMSADIPPKTTQSCEKSAFDMLMAVPEKKPPALKSAEAERFTGTFAKPTSLS